MFAIQIPIVDWLPMKKSTNVKLSKEITDNIALDYLHSVIETSLRAETPVLGHQIMGGRFHNQLKLSFRKK